MDFSECFLSSRAMLMEGALGERLKREYGLAFDEHVAMAGLVYDAEGSKALRALWTEYREIACRYRLPFLAATPTRRANRDRVAKSRFDPSIIKDNVDFLNNLKRGCTVPMFTGGLMGCKGDAYQGDDSLSVDKAREFHLWQAELFQKAGADYLYAGIMPALPEAVGMAQAMETTGLPYIISFMIRKNGRLMDGTSIHDAILAIDGAVSRKPVCYMTNCVHPLVLREALLTPMNQTPAVKERFLGIQANTSPLPPEALDGSCELQASGAKALADAMAALAGAMDIKIYGGCCGTDGSHMEEISKIISNHPASASSVSTI